MTYKASIGLEGGGPTMWWGSITPDQQGMDDFSLMYDSEPLTAALEILGRPVAKLHASNCPSYQPVKSARRNLKNQ